MIRKGIYKHYKGNRYEVIGTVTHSETLETLVLYKALKTDQLWVRPLPMFEEEIEVDGRKVKRFLFQEKV